MKRSGTTAKSDHLAIVIKLLKKYYPNAECALHHRNAFELLIATILSAQCTDERVNKVTPELFKRFPTPQKMSKASLTELEELVRTTGFYKNKARSLKETATKIANEHDGEVPKDKDVLVTFPGVGTKTANVVLGNAYGIASGVVVDTHVSRLSQRLGFTKMKDAKKIELDLEKKLPPNEWIGFSHLLIHHGRQICKARTPLCERCFLFDVCPKIGVSN